MAVKATGAVLTLQPWSGDVFTVSLKPQGRFAAVAQQNGGLPLCFAQFQIDAQGRFNKLRLSLDNKQGLSFGRDTVGDGH